MAGYPSVQQTLLNCSNFVNSPHMPPFIFSGYGPVNATAQLVLNNLVEINEVQKTFVLDMKFRLTWKDPRFTLTSLFSAIDPSFSKNGINVSPMMNDQQFPFRLWLPDIHFSDAQSMHTLQEYVSIKKNGVIYWSRHLALTLSQSNFDYTNFPMDNQNLQIRFESYSYPSTVFNLQFTNFTYDSNSQDGLTLYPPVQLYQDETSGDSAPNFEQNPLWRYRHQYTAEVTRPNFASNPTNPRLFSQATVTLSFARQNAGFLLRFGLPITGVTCIGGLLFWDGVDTRLSNTITLLLTVSSLFVAIFSAIPLVGYVTKMDQFVFTMFTILLFCAVAHIIVSITERNSTPKGMRKYPNQLKSSLFLSYMLELVGRTGVPLLPFVVAIFVFPTQPFYTVSSLTGRIVLFAVIYAGMFLWVVFYYSSSSMAQQWRHVAYSVAISEDPVRPLDKLFHVLYTKVHPGKLEEALRTGNVKEFTQTYLDDEPSSKSIKKVASNQSISNLPSPPSSPSQSQSTAATHTNRSPRQPMSLGASHDDKI